MTKLTDDILYGRSALKNGEPYIVPDALDYLNSIVAPTWTVFEWGAGGSTVYFARHCAAVISIEHAQKWTERVRKMVASMGNVSIQYVPIGNSHANPDAILSHPDGTFNMVFVDGEARVRDRCLENSWSKVVDGGYIMLDNSNWWKGSLPEGWERVDFIETGLKWIGVKDPFDWWTSFFKKGTP